MIISDKVRETSDLTEKDTCNVNQPETAEEFTCWGTEELYNYSYRYELWHCL